MRANMANDPSEVVDQTADFISGFEAGRLFEAMTRNCLACRTISGSALPFVERMAPERGYALEVMPLEDGGINVRLTPLAGN